MMTAAAGCSMVQQALPTRSGRLALVLLLALPGCALFPREFNLSPLWFHRVDPDGRLLELDCLWPIVHYERTPAGGDDFRIRPIYRRITEPQDQATEQQFLWPLGRTRRDPEEQSSRLFPVWSWRLHRDEKGRADVDWYAFFPFFWGGHNEARDEDYFAFLPFYADIPQFLTYDRFRTVLFPLWVRLDKNGHRHSLALWPLIGWSNCATGQHSWWHVLPFWGQDLEPGQYERRWLFWPFLSWGRENLDTEDPVSTFWLWPLFGLRSSRTVSGWAFLWPFFEKLSKQDTFYKLNLLWPLFHWYENRLEDDIVQWWLFPLVAHTVSNDQRAWNFLWPLVWWREYDDPDGRSAQFFVLPFFWQRHREDTDQGTRRDALAIWPLFHRRVVHDRDDRRIEGEWNVPDLVPYHEGAGEGFAANYGFLWELAAGRQRAADDRSFDLAARLFTTRRQQGRRQSSVPWLWSSESDADGGTTVRLFQLLPLHFGGGAAEARR